MNKKGVNLIEMTAVIVVLSVSVPVLLTMWADVAWRSSQSESISDAAFYAQELMEEIKSKAFVDPDEPGVTALGPNGETYPNLDDVDDFNGYLDNPGTGYIRSVIVDYVALNGSLWQNSGAPTDFKRIKVSISRNDNLITDSSLVAIVSKH